MLHFVCTWTPFTLPHFQTAALRDLILELFVFRTGLVLRTIDTLDLFFDPVHINPIPIATVRPTELREKLDAFPHLPYSKLPFKTQIDFLNSLRTRDTLKLASGALYWTRTIRFGSADSKSIIWNRDGFVYDIAPHWLRFLPKSFTDTTRCQPSTQQFSKCFFSRANLSFSHFVATDLAQIIIADKCLPADVPIISPWLTSWQKSLLCFFGIKRRVKTMVSSSMHQQVFEAGFTDSYVIEDLNEYEGLHYCRSIAQGLLPPQDNLLDERYQPIVWLGRYHYEKKWGLPPRTTNLSALVPLIKARSIIYLDPIMCTLKSVANLVSNAKLIISESGSHFINYLLFARPGVPIIQLSPCGCLAPTWSYYNVNNMQWYYPVKSHLYFYEGINLPQKGRRYGSPWNTPSAYDPLGLDLMISELLSA